MTRDLRKRELVVAGTGGGASIHPFPKTSTIPQPVSRDDVALEQAGEMAAHAMSTLLRLSAMRPSQKVSDAFASSTELSQLIDTFLKIRDPDQRRYCLAVARSCALQDEGRR